MELTHTVGAVITLALGLLGLLAPRWAAALVGLQPLGTAGLSEIRATYGGLFVGLALAVLFSREDGAVLAAGVAWGGAAVARLVSIVVSGATDPRNLGGVLVEGLPAVLFLTP